MSGGSPAAAPSRSSRHLVDPDLLPALDAMPSFSVNADTLGDIRRAMAETRVPAPPAPRTSVQERLVPGPDGKSLRVLVFAPEAPVRDGALLWLHGGGMVMATADANEALCRHLATVANCIVVAVDYRLAPEHPFPAALEDCHAALVWTKGAASELGFSADRIAVAGESGGGCLAAGLSLLARDRGDIALTAQFLLYPMLDDRTGTAAEPDPLPYAGEFVWTTANNRFAWNAVLGDECGSERVSDLAAPARSTNLRGVPPTAIFIGDLDLFAGENIRFARQLLRDGVPVELQLYPGAYHGFISFAQDAPVSQRAFQAFRGTIERHFARRSLA